MNYVEGDVEVFNNRITSEELRAWKAPPRPKPLLHVVEEEDDNIRPASGWDVSKSVFKKVKQDTPDLMSKCFEFDWQCSRIERMLEPASKDQRDRIFNFLKDNYRNIKDGYKFFSGLSPANGVCSIGTNLFNYIIFNCNGMVD